MYVNHDVGMGMIHTLEHNNYATSSYEDQKLQDYNHLMMLSS